MKVYSNIYMMNINCTLLARLAVYQIRVFNRHALNYNLFWSVIWYVSGDDNCRITAERWTFEINY